MKPTKLIDVFQQARKSKDVAVIEGVQALKHAARFDAEIKDIITCDILLLKKYCMELAPDIAHVILKMASEVDEVTFSKLSPQPPRTGVIALAKKKTYKLSNTVKEKPIIFLENPKDLENIGAVIRVAAAADAAGVVVSGEVDIWHPAIIRGAAGLHYALPVFNQTLGQVRKKRVVVSLDPAGEGITKNLLSSFSTSAVLVFGTERHGISPKTLELSDSILRLPMKEGVSSLNLATSVAATLYMMK